MISGSLKHSSLIDEVCRSHAQLAKSSYGQLVGRYGRMILGKLAFHSRNPNVPGNFGMKNKLESVEAGELFELGVEFLDQLEATCGFMKTIFDSFEVGNKSISLTTSGQCRLSALIPCTHDTSRLLELTTNLIRLLHLALPFDTLEGHRQRFHTIHKELRQLYETMNNVIYLRSMVQIPRLASDITHFFETLKLMSVSETLAPEEPTFDMIKHVEDAEELVSVADESVADASMAYIQQEYSDLSSRYQMVLQMLETEQLAKGQQEQENAKLKEQVEALRQTELSQVSSGGDNEKLEKLKAAYQKLRTDHINALRQKGELDKKLIAFKTEEDRSSVQLQSLKSHLLSFLQSREIPVQGEDIPSALTNLGSQLDNLQLSLLSKENSQAKENEELNGTLETLTAEVQSQRTEKISLRTQLSELGQTKTRIEEAWRHEIDWKMKRLSGFVGNSGDQLDNELKSIVEIEAGLGNEDRLISYLLMSLVQLIPSMGIDGVSPDALYLHIEEILNGWDSADQKSQALKAFNDEVLRQNQIARNNKQGSDQDVDAQIKTMQSTIHEAAIAMEKMMLAARANETKKNIDVDIKILDSCSHLINAIQQLIKEAAELQAEITSASGTLAKDFYRNNQKWSQGLISAAKDIGRGAKYLVETSDGVVNGTAKFEELSVAAHEIAGSTGTHNLFPSLWLDHFKKKISSNRNTQKNYLSISRKNGQIFSSNQNTQI